MNGSLDDKLRNMQTIFNGNGPVFDTANFAFSVLFEGAGVSKTLSRTRHLLMDEYDYSPEDAAAIVNMVRNLVYDPMAPHGVKPGTDPTVKKYMDKFQLISEYAAGTIIWHLGIGGKARQRIASLGEELRKFLRGRPDAVITEDLLHRLDRDGAARPRTDGNPRIAEKRGDYDAIPIESSVQLAETLSRLGATDVQWCIRDTARWNEYSSNGRNAFYILYNNKLTSGDPMSIIGAFVTPTNRPAYSFDRLNRAVSLETTSHILAEAGVDMTPPNDDELLAALNDNLYELDEVFPDYEVLKTGMYLVKSEDGGMGAIVVDDHGHYRSLTDGWVDIDRIGTIEDRRYTQCVTDGKAIYSLYAPFEKIGEVPDGLTITTELASESSDRIVFVKRDGRIVNIFDCYNGELLLDPESDVEFNDSQFVFAEWNKRAQRYMDEASVELGPKNYWIIMHSKQSNPTRVYVVNKKGETLANCPCIEIPADSSVQCVSRNGRFCAFRRNQGDIYIMADGKVYPESFIEVDQGTGDGIWALYSSPDEDAPYYELDTKTGKTDIRHA